MNIHQTNVYRSNPLGRTPTKKPPPVKPKPNMMAKDNEKEPVEVFCRIRPMKLVTDLVCVHKMTESILTVKSPSSSRDDCHYAFKKILDEYIGQKQLFETVARPLVSDLLKGKDGLLFTYGITSSGKTHTIVGKPQNCGVLPRALDVVFNSIKEQQSRKFSFKPDGQNTFEVRATPDALLEWQKERSAGSKPPSTPSAYGKTPKVRRQEAAETREWCERAPDPTIVDVNKNCRYSVFISYVEIYNNYIYDLLDDSVEEQFKSQGNKQPQSKFLREDNRKRIFVFGVNEVEVENAEEAIEVFLKGVRRRRIAHTALNTESSRSHSVFNIRVVQAEIDAHGEVIQDSNAMKISQLSIVDLAGSERTSRTQATGERQREAGNINNSLMALRNCIEILRENQKCNTNKIVPYRDNKLTHLFKNYFEGEGKVRMIICVNPSQDEYQETLHVMKFAETTQEVVTNKASEYIYPQRLKGVGTDAYGNYKFSSAGTLGPALPTTLFSNNPNDEKIIPEWLECLDQRKKVVTRKVEELMQKQMAFREEVARIEKENHVVKQENDILKMDLVAREHQLKLLESQCGQRERTTEGQEKKIQGLEKSVRDLQRELERNSKLFTQIELEKERMKQKFSEQLRDEQQRVRRIYEREMAEKLTRLNREKCINEEKINKVHEILCSNNSDWNLFDNAQATAPSVSPLPSNTASGSAGTSSGLPGKTGISSTPSRSSPSKGRSKSVDRTLVSKRRSEYDIVNAMSPRSELASEYACASSELPPVANPRHRRSLSTGTEKWIDHRPRGTLDLGTVFQPKLKNRKSLSNLKNIGVNELKDASKYALTHHVADLNGEVETHVYKGEVIPSVGGGAQVIFQDVETLRQGSPPGRKRFVTEGKPPETPSSVMLNDQEPMSPLITKRSRR